MKKVPFYPNTDDELHCFEACMKMMLKYFLPDRDFSFAELERMSNKKPGLATWPHNFLVNLHKMGMFDIKIIEDFDGEAFIKDGLDYIRREYGNEEAEWDEKYSDIPAEQETYREYLDIISHEDRPATFADIRACLDKGMLVKPTVNYWKLRGKDGYAGHAVVVYDMDDTSIMFHDPGPPPSPDQRLSLKAFDAAWAYPNEKARDLLAIKLKESA